MIPLHSAEGNVRQPDGSQKIGIVDYYSPFHFYIVTELCHNTLLNGELWYSESIDWYPEKQIKDRPRYIAWGSGMGFHAREINDIARNKTDDYVTNPYALVAMLDSFLRFIHTTPLMERHAIPDESIDIFANAPVFDHDLSAIKLLPETLKKYQLNVKKLQILRMNIGRAAAVIDPLELWHYYVERHPGVKKSLLKGDAQIAQRLYKIYNLVTEVWERTTNDKALPLLDFIGGEFGGGYLTPKAEYLHGVDVKAMRQSIDAFNHWSLEKRHKKFVTPEIRQALSRTTAELDDYEKRYGDRGYGGNYRVRKDEGISYDKLDDSAKKFFDQVRAQSNDDDWEIISWAIENHLDDIQRSLSAVYRSVSEQLRAITSEAWDTHQNLGNNFWREHSELSQQEKMVLIQKESQRLLDIAKKCQEKEREFWKTVSNVGLAFCKACRQRPIIIHDDSRGFGLQSQPSICDGCVQEARESEKLKNLKHTEWKCIRCGERLYKFFHDNTLSDLLFNRANSAIVATLLYGKLRVEVRCPNKDCQELNVREIESGWLP